MGSPLSPILADMVMDDLESYCLNSLDFCVPVYYRYVDDIFAIIPRSKIIAILTIFNSYHERLQFTHEIEYNSTINFLNTTVIRQDNRLITNWYRKPTWSGRYINFLSHHPFKYKCNTIYSLVDHAILLSDDRYHIDNIKIVKEILLNNGFPINITNWYIYKRINFLKSKDGNNNDQLSDKIPYISLPYVRDVTENIAHSLKNSGIKVVYNLPKKLNTIIKTGKDLLPKERNTNVVYQLKCNDCNASYIGQTKRHLYTRIKEHCNNIKLHPSSYSVVSKHRSELAHEFDWENCNILHSERNVNKRELAEMFFIKKLDNTINSQKDTENLNNIYDKIIKVT